MPILSAEPDLYPPALLDRPPADGRGWLVAHTRPRQEKALARRLLAAGLPFYLPCTENRVRAGRRVLVSRVPVFPGYLFARGTAADRVRVLDTGRAAAVLRVVDADRLWDDLRRVRRVLDSGAPLEPHDRAEPGDPVRVRSGPLAGLTGTVVRHAGGCRLLVRVDFIGRGVAVELGTAELARLAPRGAG